MSDRVFATAQKPAKAAAPPALMALTQRRCSCGQHVIGRTPCADCQKKSPRLHRKKSQHARKDEDFVPAKAAPSPGQGQSLDAHAQQELVAAESGYNSLAPPALAITRDIDAGRPRQADLVREYKQVTKQDGRWIVTDPGIDTARGGRIYELKLANETNPESEPLLPGLNDPMNPNQLARVDRPIESAPGRPPQP